MLRELAWLNFGFGTGVDVAGVCRAQALRLLTASVADFVNSLRQITSFLLM